jgi:hypothetical protein
MRAVILAVLLCASALPAADADFDRRLSRILREMQLALEGSSANGFLAPFDGERFPDYLRFRDVIQRLMRENSARAAFEVADTAVFPSPEKAQIVLDAEMELSRRDAAGQTRRRSERLKMELQRTPRGWRVTNLSPRSFFDPL